MKGTLAAILILLSLTPAQAFAKDPPKFQLPLNCTLDETCWAVNYVDMDPAESSAKDFTCGPRTYDAHKGTDFAVRSRAEMEEGVDVLAALGGTVLRVRDGETDTVKAQADLDKIKSETKDCGNGVFIDHATAGFPGLSTIYCHLKQGSLAVKPGDPVLPGQKIAEIGQSGFAEFPHLHFGIIWEGGIMDPYTGRTAREGCGDVKQSLWRDSSMAYAPASIYDGGFADGPPDFEAVKNGAAVPETLSADGPALVFWAAFFGVRTGDAIAIEIRDPEDRIFAERRITQDETRARQFYYTGRTLENLALPPGIYTGHVRLERDGRAAGERSFAVRLD